MVDFFGTLLAILAALGNGTFAIPSKIEPARSCGIEPYIFNFYVGLGIGVSSLFVPLLFGCSITFTWLGIVAGTFLSVSSASSFAAVKYLGISAASGIWCGTAIIISFFYGYFFEEPVSNLPLALLALAILVASILGITYAQRKSDEADALSQPLNGDIDPSGGNSASSFIKGIINAVIAGTFGGLILSPENYAPSESSGLSFLFSFGIGTLMASPVVNFLPFLLAWKTPRLFLREAGGYGFAGGIIWNFQNLCALLAIGRIGYSVAYPIVQCGLFVAGLWGILLFDEIKGRFQKYYWLSGLSLLAGAITLNLSK